MENINLIALRKEDFEEIRLIMEDIREFMTRIHEKKFENDYLRSSEIPKLLGISQKTWQNYRDKGRIPFIQFGSKIWVKRSDIEKFFDKHLVPGKG